jgi:glycosyltransferase involved in cell wall biosynthesis
VSFYDSAFVGGSLHKSFVKFLGFSAGCIFDGYDTIDNQYFTDSAVKVRIDTVGNRAALDLPSRYILSLGRFVSKKNLILVICAYADLVDSGRHNGHDMVLVGSGAEYEKLVELALERGLQVIIHNSKRSITKTEVEKIAAEHKGCVHFSPFAQIDTVPAYFALATAFVLASYKEEWGLVVNEAMACGCPVLVSRSVGSAPDLVRDGVTGYSFSPTNQVELVTCMAKVCGDVDHAKKLGVGALAHIGQWSNTRFAHNALRAAYCAMGGAGVVI